MAIEIKAVNSKADLKLFIHLPEYIHRHNKNWVPPVYADERKFYNPEFNHQLRACETVLYMSYADGKPTGRIMGIIHHNYNQAHQIKSARFFNLECINHKETVDALLKAIETWAGNRKMDSVIGPFGFSDKDPQGLQVEGFENLPVIATATNMSYLPDLVHANGYRKEKDCVVYKINVPEKIPGRAAEIANRISQGRILKLIEFKRRSQLRKYIVPVLKLVNETYRHLMGFVEMTGKEMFELADKYLPMLDPEFTKVVIDEKGQPIAFVVASPDISRGIQKAHGKIFPVGFIPILICKKKSVQLDLFLGAVKEEWRGTGATALLASSLFASAIKRKMKIIDTHLILEDNIPMRTLAEKFGGVVYKRYRIFYKKLLN